MSMAVTVTEARTANEMGGQRKRMGYEERENSLLKTHGAGAKDRKNRPSLVTNTFCTRPPPALLPFLQTHGPSAPRSMTSRRSGCTLVLAICCFMRRGCAIFFFRRAGDGDGSFRQDEKLDSYTGWMGGIHDYGFQ